MLTSASPQLSVRFPAVGGDAPDQDAEFCEVTVDGAERRVRFHDYAEIFSIPGLYEEIFHTHLRCTSPTVVTELLVEELRKADVDPATLRGLDVGAGNGLVGEELRRHGIGALVGVDLLPEAALAAERDRPGVYADYVACDLTALSADEHARLTAHDPNLLTTVAALGFGDIPCQAFLTAFDALADEGWVAFNIKAEFLDDTGRSEFADCIADLVADGRLEERARLRYDHRLSMTGEALEYVAVVGVKHDAQRGGRFTRSS